MNYQEKRMQHILDDRPKKEKKKNFIPPVAEKRKAKNELYKIVREDYLVKHRFCECGCGRRATEIHHMRGKIGSLLCDIRYFKAVSSFCHRAIEDKPKEAKERGLSESRLCKVDKLN